MLKKDPEAIKNFLAQVTHTHNARPYVSVEAKGGKSVIVKEPGLKKLFGFNPKKDYRFTGSSSTAQISFDVKNIGTVLSFYPAYVSTQMATSLRVNVTAGKGYKELTKSKTRSY